VEKRGRRGGSGDVEEQVEAEAVEESDEVEEATSMSEAAAAAAALRSLLLVVGVCDRRADVHRGFCTY
jgi:hypothetical protein